MFLRLESSQLADLRSRICMFRDVVILCTTCDNAIAFVKERRGTGDENGVWVFSARLKARIYTLIVYTIEDTLFRHGI